MDANEVRMRVLEDHAGLRKDLEALEALNERVVQDALDGDVEKLRGDAQVLLDKLQNHMRWEEHYLLPALKQADAWGTQRAEQLVCDHTEQRRLLDFIIERLRDGSRPDALIVKDVAGLISFLREDMEEEERDLLDERVLRDDVIGIDVMTG